MDAQQFLATFEYIASAPRGIIKMREMILSLAFQGRICPLSDETADSLLDDFVQQREAFNGETRKQRLARQSNRTNLARTPFSIPSNWRWVSLSAVGHTWGQKKPSEVFTYIDVSSIDNKRGCLATTLEVMDAASAPSRARKLVKPGTLVYSTVRPYLLNIAIVDREFEHEPIASTAFAVIHPWNGLSPRYLYYFLRSPLFVKYVESLQIGMAYPAISDEKFYSALMPLPPTEEQFRIVAKIDELMALCDKLESQQQQRRDMQTVLRRSTLQAVVAAPSSHELQNTWARLAGNFGFLFQTQEDVDHFIAELKNMAVRGLLSLPSPDSPALGSIVQSCEELRSQYIESGLMRRQKVTAAADTEMSYPKHWAVAPFDEVAIVLGGVTKGRNLRGREVVTCPYLAVANVQRGFFKLNELKTIQIGTEELEKYLVREGDLLITEGGDWDKVGRTAIWNGGIDNCIHQNHVFKARVPSAALLNEWVELVFNSNVGRDYFAGASKQTTNLASINMTQLRGFPLPIPPLGEQRAILEKLDVLTMRSAIWQEQLQKKHDLASLLAGSTIAAITGITPEQDKDEPMKAPQTELIASLHLGKTPDAKAQAPLASILAHHKGELLANDLWQRFGGEIDAFYAQLKTEVAHGWIAEPKVAEMRERQSAQEST